MTEWTREESLQFIKYYEETPVLWDAKEAKLYGKVHRNEAWIDVAQKTGRTVQECKSKMLSLLSAMRRERAKLRKSIERGGGPNGVYQSKWFAFKNMQFLVPIDNLLEIASMMQVRKTEQRAIPEPDDYLIEEDPPAVPPDLPPTNPNPARHPFSSPGKLRKKNLLDERLDTCYEIHKTCASTQDEEQDFGNFTAKKLRKYDSLTKSAVQHAIMGIFLSADMGLFQKPSIPSGVNNPGAWHSSAEPPFNGLNIPSLAQLRNINPTFNTPSTSAAPQPTEPSTSSPPKPTGPPSHDTHSVTATQPKQSRAVDTPASSTQPTRSPPLGTSSTPAAPQPSEQYVFTLASDDEISPQEMICINIK